MSKTKKLVPKRRFKGYNNEWKLLSRIGDYSEILTGGTPSTQEKSFWQPKEILWMSSGEVHRKRILYTDNMISKKGFENSSARWVKENSILIALAGQGKTRGTVAINHIPITTNQSIASITPSKILNSEFLFQNFDMRYEELRTISSGDGTRGGLNKKIIFNMNIITPSLKEQTQIGEFFKKLDTLIQTQQKKLEKTKTLKSAYLAEMFPCDGELKPKLRFNGFCSDWQFEKIDNVANRYNNLRIPITASNRIPGSTPYYGANGIQDYVKGFTHNGEYILVAEDGANDLLNYPVQYVKGKIWVNNHAHVLQGKNNVCDNKFLMYAFKCINMEPYLVGGGRAKLNSDVMMNIIILAPDIREQTKIGNFFKLLDQKIALEQRKLEKLKKIKQAYLNEMFV